MTKQLTFGSLFAGIGGFDLGLERAGMQCAWQVEIDAFCRKVLAKHWPDVPKYKDVRDVGANQLPQVDLICGGFPCQPISRAGKQRGKEDPRWLWPEYFRIVSEIRPKYVVVENTSSLIKLGLGDILRDFSSLGYDAEWESITAFHFGAPHERQRIFLVAYPHSERCNSPILRTRNTIQDQTWNSSSSTFRRTYQQHWACEPVSRTLESSLGRVVDGIPNRVDRLRALGNAVVPQIAEWVGRRIIMHANSSPAC